MKGGKNEDRPGLQKCLKALQKGNTLVVWKLDRLGPDLKNLVTVIYDLRKRDIGFKVLAGQGTQIDTTTPNGRLVFGLFDSIAADVDRTLGVTTATLYKHVNADGTLKAAGQKILKENTN